MSTFVFLICVALTIGVFFSVWFVIREPSESGFDKLAKLFLVLESGILCAVMFKLGMFTLV